MSSQAGETPGEASQGVLVGRRDAGRAGGASLLDWGRLLRLSLLPSCLADVVCGVLVGHRGRWPDGPAPWLLLAASPLVYHGAMVLNDWADRDRDRINRPERPLPSGRIEASDAFVLGAGMLFAGVALALLASIDSGLVLAVVALIAWSYDTRGRGPWLGPALLAMCRAGNVSLGLALAATSVWGCTWQGQGGGGFDGRITLPVAYGAYVFVVSRLGRYEDGEAEESLASLVGHPRALTVAAALVLALAGALPVAADSPSLSVAGVAGRASGIVVAFVAAIGLARGALAPPRGWSRARILQTMGRALRSLLLFTSAATLVVGTPPAIVSGVLLLVCGQGLGWSLRRVFPPS